ncbi:Asp-tRNA(Asn)/Glu-tRNA(Gln) amidotransferase subunit GatC [Desulfoprunum benzoelyticum]|uniref:Aspartyl/glutamyl-tRNA(Asn/Gln) amidotransferase subunit C n=1 Tax=Desulfoprunum benzoelyticum TaxID=1506996 RepID=A0A840V2Y2_9BACT|nr:Asp-tRNA(Asn)/Glu-tRNA(Gln) amidotransferase subunit GatC [Desulfoprunum benzoelyticum]MBB5347491.1 aspartyl-tRNA(Asn)/glutamyl-tRNA(Gln) amidotransferase subunit C [Desulfoprunum benzoelyticum]MBM9529632.1 Asp-tRNA(Asn)/Glu-tRNA(Gln) amidotransferase subunit GatC [Desulfoprunum benzoelyticum]
MKISRAEVEHVAHLARLHLTEGELSIMTEQLDLILAYVEKLQELDTNGLPPTTHAISVCNAFREDRVLPSLAQDVALSCSSRHNEEMFQVPRII